MAHKKVKLTDAWSLRRDELLADGYTQDTRKLSRENTHPRDQYIFFREADHKYILSRPNTAEQTMLSSSTFVKQFFEPFEEDVVIKRMMSSLHWNKSRYYRMTADQIKAQWEENRDLGTVMHDSIERYLNDETLPASETSTVEFQQFLDFELEWLRPLHVDVYRTEWRVYDEGRGLCGTLDWICVYQTQPDPKVLSMMLLDHKRCLEIKVKEKRYKGLGCCADVYANNYYKYGLALNLYKYILEKHYHNVMYKGKTYARLRVHDMYLNVMHPAHSGYQVFQIPDMGKKLEEMFVEKN